MAATFVFFFFHVTTQHLSDIEFPLDSISQHKYANKIQSKQIDSRQFIDCGHVWHQIMSL